MICRATLAGLTVHAIEAIIVDLTATARHHLPVTKTINALLQSTGIAIRANLFSGFRSAAIGSNGNIATDPTITFINGTTDPIVTFGRRFATSGIIQDLVLADIFRTMSLGAVIFVIAIFVLVAAIWIV